MNNANRPIDCKREEYRKYLERTGVLEALTKTLSSLYEETEKPSDGLGYLYKVFNESFPDKTNQSKELEQELADAKAKIEQLTIELAAAKAELEALKSAEEKEEEAMLEDTPDIPQGDPEPAPVPVETTSAPSDASLPEPTTTTPVVPLTEEAMEPAAEAEVAAAAPPEAPIETA